MLRSLHRIELFCSSDGSMSRYFILPRYHLGTMCILFCYSYDTSLLYIQLWRYTHCYLSCSVNYYYNLLCNSIIHFILNFFQFCCKTVSSDDYFKVILIYLIYNSFEHARNTGRFDGCKLVWKLNHRLEQL